MVAEHSGRKRGKNHLRKVTTYDPKTGEVVTRVERDADNAGAKIQPLPPAFYPANPLELDHWALPRDLRLSRRDANLAGLRFFLINASFTESCESDRIVPLADLICAAADVCSAAAAQWDTDYEDLVGLLTGETDARTFSDDFAAYADHKGERDRWRQQVRDLTGLLEPEQERAIDAMDRDDLWQLLTQVDYAVGCYRDAGGT